MSSLQRRIGSNKPIVNDVNKENHRARCELDSHVDTVCAGSSHYVYNVTEKVCDVTGFHNKYDAIPSVPVATTMTAYDCVTT